MPPEISKHKDFFEHLRLVHFSLLATSLALLIGTTLPTRAIYDNAVAQLEQIQDGLSRLHKKYLFENRGLSAQLSSLFGEKFLLRLKNGDISLSPMWGSISSFNQHPEFLGSPSQAPDPERAVLEDFVHFWDSSRKTSSLRRISGFTDQPPEIQLAPGYPSPASIIPDPGIAPRRYGQNDFIVEQTSGGKWQVRITFSSGDRGFEGSVITFPIRVGYETDMLAELTHTEALSWKPRGDFSKSFPELDALSMNLRSIKLTDLEQHLKTLRQREGVAIEVLGAKMPAELIKSWGLLVLLSVQIYFYLHLTLFRQDVAPHVLGHEYPWIGLYTSPAARVTFAVTVSVIPVIAVAAVILFDVGGLSPIGWVAHWASAVGSLAMSIVTLLEFKRVLDLRHGGLAELSSNAVAAEDCRSETTAPS